MVAGSDKFSAHLKLPSAFGHQLSRERAISDQIDLRYIEPVLTGRAVVITGAGGGLGRAYALAAAAAGARVVVNDLDPDAAGRVTAEITEVGGGNAVAHPADVSNWDAAGGLIDRCVDEFGRIDALINNAGVFALALPQEQRPEPLRQMLDVNVFGTAACGHHALRHMVRQGGGVVLNVTSGEQMGKTSSAAYGATKAAVAALTYSWSVDMAEYGVRVNAISPNAHSGMAAIYLAYRGAAAGSQNVGLDPSINAPLALYLLSDLSSGITGQVVRQNGRELMLCTHPAILEPVLQSEQPWTVQSISAAFDTQLRAQQQPVGISSVRQTSQ